MKDYKIAGYCRNGGCLTWATEAKLEETVQRLRQQGYGKFEIKEERERAQDFDPADVSLCRSCQCMTHAILGGRCGKCKQVKVNDDPLEN